MSKVVSRVVLLYVAFILTGCATVTRGTTQDIPVSSVPSGAQVIINNQFWGVTPVIANLDRRDRHNLVIQLEGYEPFLTTIASQRDMASAGNRLVGGLPGAAVNFVLTPETVHAVLVAHGEQSPPMKKLPSEPQQPVITPAVSKQQQKSDESHAVVLVAFAVVFAVGVIVLSSGP